QQDQDQQRHAERQADCERPVKRVTIRKRPAEPAGKEIRDVGHQTADDQGNRLQESEAAQRQDGCRGRKGEWHNAHRLADITGPLQVLPGWGVNSPHPEPVLPHFTRALCFLRKMRPLCRSSPRCTLRCSAAPTCPSAAALASLRSTWACPRSNEP